MSNLEKFNLILKNMIHFMEQSNRNISYPNAEELLEESYINPPDIEEYFEDAVDIYRHLDEGIQKLNVLLHGAVCFYVSYEDLSERVRLAIIKLLWSGGDYYNACLFALEFFSLEYVQGLLLESMPLIMKNHKLSIRHLMLPYWKSEVILAVIVKELSQYGQLERESVLKAMIYKIEKLEELPDSLLEAICTFLYNYLVQNKEVEKQKFVDFVQENSYIEIAKEFFKQYCQFTENRDFDILQREYDEEWLNRQNTFDRVYEKREKKGYFIYNPEMKGAILLHSSLLMAYELNIEYTSVQVKALGADMMKDISLSIKYKYSSGSFVISASKQLEYKEVEQLADRITKLKKIYQANNDLMNVYNSFHKYYKIASIFEKMQHYMDYSKNKDVSLRLFNQYIGYKWHDQKLVRDMISLLLKDSKDQLSDKNYITLFNYYLRIDDYDAACNFAEVNKDKLGKKYFKIAEKQLKKFLEDSYHAEKRLFNLFSDSEWRPASLQEGYGKFVKYFLNYGWKIFRDRNTDFEATNSMELYQESEKLRRMASNNANQKNLAAEYYLMAGAVLNRRREEFGVLDTNETMTDFMIHAFYNWSCQEAEKLDMNSDVRRTYIEQALRLSKQLDPRYIEGNMKGILEDMQKRYFKMRVGHDNDNLGEAVKYMSQNSMVSDIEFGNCLLRLSIYYPDILVEPEIIALCGTDEKIRQRLISFMSLSGLGISNRNGILSGLREYRDCLVKEFNDFDFQIHKEEDAKQLKAELNKIAVQTQRFCTEKEFYRILSELDKKYINSFKELLLKILEESIDFQTLCLYRKKCAKLKADIEKNPCSFAIEYLYGCGIVLINYIEEIYEHLYKEVKPELLFQALFVEDVPTELDTVQVYLLIKNVKGKSAVLGVTASLHKSKWISGTEDQSICSYVRQDGLEYGFVSMRLASSIIDKEKLCFDITFNYIVELTGEKQSKSMKLEVPLENRRLKVNYEQMYNHTSALDAEHDMAKYTFYGRDELINRICHIFYNFPMSVVILYGQRRVGKTSVANHIAARIHNSDKRIFVVKCGNSNLSIFPNDKVDYTENAIRELYALIIQKLLYTIKNDYERVTCLAEEIKVMEELVEGKKQSEQLKITPLMFEKVIMELQRAFEREACWRGTRILLWFDEFQQYYFHILQGKIQPEFVGFIKAFVENYGFSLLLVGCEPMLPFIQDERFGNTFSASTQVYVEYLTEEYAKSLICEPIQRKCARENPFVYIKDEIYRLSAGSPYFIQLICKNLIDDLNSQKKVYANKQMIIESLNGNGQVSHASFDCLYNSLDQREKAASSQDNEKILISIALLQGERKGSQRCDIIKRLEGNTQKPVAMIIDDLIRRKVVEEVQGELRIVVRLYEAWIWENRFELGYYESSNLDDLM